MGARCSRFSDLCVSLTGADVGVRPTDCIERAIRWVRMMLRYQWAWERRQAKYPSKTSSF
jgi:hypothetical protein